MKQNVGAQDQLVRTLLGAVLGSVSLGVLAGIVPGATWVSPLLGVASLGLFYTALTGVCGLYAALGIDTCSVDPESA